MLLFVSDYPTSANEKDGMMQRIATIETMASSQWRIYIDVFQAAFSIKRQKRRFFLPKLTLLKPKLLVLRVNYFACYWLIKLLFKAAKLVYIHSIYNAEKVLPFLPLAKNKLVLDAHGAVPEECDFLHGEALAQRFAAVEEDTFRHVSTVVVVSQNMQATLLQKYPAYAGKFIILPIFKPDFLPKTQTSASKLNTTEEPLLPLVLYAGGLQKWQNVALMLSVAATQSEHLRFLFLVPDIEAFKQEMREQQPALLQHPNVRVASVPHHEIPSYYRQATYGFILREDHVLNRVSCPTKLTEYLCFDLLPILLSPTIGDFEALGVKGVTVEALRAGHLPCAEEQASMLAANRNALSQFVSQVEQGQTELACLLKLN